MSESEAALLRCQGLSRHYHRRTETIRALDDVNLVLCRGEHVVLIGPSGSGKTSLLQLLAGLDTPTAGTVEFAGQDFARLQEAQLAQLRARKIGFIFQDFGLVRSLTALENVRLQLSLSQLPAAPDRCRQLLEELGLGERLGHLPRELSRGELQRVAIARALIHDPVLLLADEPTGSLDAAASEAVAEVFTHLRRRRDLTVLVATHDAEWTSRAGRVIEIRNGRIQEQRAS